jgi:hypothetical protein
MSVTLSTRPVASGYESRDGNGERYTDKGGGAVRRKRITDRIAFVVRPGDLQRERPDD